MQTEWTPRAGSDDTWERKIDEQAYCYAHQYAGSNKFNWQAVRGLDRLSGIVGDRDSAMAHADAAIALPVDEFNARLLAELADELRDIERKIARLSPTTDILPGYHAGYADGMDAMKRKIEAAMEPEPC